MRNRFRFHNLFLTLEFPRKFGVNQADVYYRGGYGGDWDGSRGTTGKGYHLCCIVGAKINSHEIVPLVKNLWSQHAPDFDSENAHILRAVDQVVAGVGQWGIYVMDRGGDRSRIYEPLLQRELRQFPDQQCLHGRTQQRLLCSQKKSQGMPVQ